MSIEDKIKKFLQKEHFMNKRSNHGFAFSNIDAIVGEYDEYAFGVFSTKISNNNVYFPIAYELECNSNKRKISSYLFSLRNGVEKQIHEKLSRSLRLSEGKVCTVNWFDKDDDGAPQRGYVNTNNILYYFDIESCRCFVSEINNVIGRKGIIS